MRSFLVGLSLVCLPGAASAFELQHPFAPKAPSASLLEAPDPIPASMRDAVGGHVFGQLSLSAQDFMAALDRADAARADLTAGGGQGMGRDSAWLGFLLGFFPGFGLGHFIVAGRPGVGTRWLVIDIVFLVVWIVLDAVLGAVYGTVGYGLWWLLFDLVLPIGWVVEHVFQGLSAYQMTAGRSPFAETLTPGEAPEAELPGGRTRVAPNLMALSF